MKFLLGSRRLILIDRAGIRIHRAPAGQHFESQTIKNQKMHILKPDAIPETTEEITRRMEKNIADRLVNHALQFHALRTEKLFKNVLHAKTAADAADLVAQEMRATEERMQEQQETQKV